RGGPPGRLSGPRRRAGAGTRPGPPPARVLLARGTRGCDAWPGSPRRRHAARASSPPNASGCARSRRSWHVPPALLLVIVVWGYTPTNGGCKFGTVRSVTRHGAAGAPKASL